jgi:hypothetical protein
MGARILTLLAGGLLSVLLVAGCGGGSSDGAGEGTTSSLSKAEFVKQADAACVKRQEEARGEFIAYGERVSKSGETTAEKEAHVATVAETIVMPELQQEIEDIRALGAPKGKEGEVEALLVALEEGVDKARAHPKRSIVESAKLLEPAGELARNLGLKICGTG